MTDPNFEQTLATSLAILAPIDEYITPFQSDAVSVSDVYQAFKMLPDRFTEIAQLSAAEIDYVTKSVEARFQLVYRIAHDLGNILDPLFLGDRMTSIRRC